MGKKQKPRIDPKEMQGRQETKDARIILKKLIILKER